MSYSVYEKVVDLLDSGMKKKDNILNRIQVECTEEGDVKLSVGSNDRYLTVTIPAIFEWGVKIGTRVLAQSSLDDLKKFGKLLKRLSDPVTLKVNCDCLTFTNGFEELLLAFDDDVKFPVPRCVNWLTSSERTVDSVLFSFQNIADFIIPEKGAKRKTVTSIRKEDLQPPDLVGLSIGPTGLTITDFHSTPFHSENPSYRHELWIGLSYNNLYNLLKVIGSKDDVVASDSSQLTTSKLLKYINRVNLVMNAKFVSRESGPEGLILEFALDKVVVTAFYTHYVLLPYNEKPNFGS
jgi:hypothetical protein